MNKVFAVSAAALAVTVFTGSGFCAAPKAEGKQLFEQHCASCHPKGGNIVNPQKTLSKKVLGANGIRNAQGIVAKMRNPGPGMTRFDAKAVPEKQARAIGSYILATFP